MARVVVHVMPKGEILDPQGQAIVGALGRLGHGGISDVRQGKRFELEVDDSVDDSALAGCQPPSCRRPGCGLHSLRSDRPSALRPYTSLAAPLPRREAPVGYGVAP